MKLEFAKVINQNSQSLHRPKNRILAKLFQSNTKSRYRGRDGQTANQNAPFFNEQLITTVPVSTIQVRNSLSMYMYFFFWKAPSLKNLATICDAGCNRSVDFRPGNYWLLRTEYVLAHVLANDHCIWPWSNSACISSVSFFTCIGSFTSGYKLEVFIENRPKGNRTDIFANSYGNFAADTLSHWSIRASLAGRTVSYALPRCH